jgi:hypothetical protein
MLRLTDDNGDAWIKKDQEYIVFLNIVTYCNYEDNIYYNLRPVAPESYTFNMYPIQNGYVYDPKDDFGFGTGLTISQFKSALRTRIDLIKNFGN